MSLAVALNSAQSSLSANATQTAIVARNINGAGDAAYSRKSALVATSGGGSVHVTSVARATNTALYLRMLDATATASSNQAFLEGLNRLAQTVEDPENGQSVAGAVGAFGNAIQTYSQAPNDPILAGAMLTSAYDLAGRVNAATQAIQAARQTADGAIAASVDRINALLGQFETANRAVMAGHAAGSDITDALDTRDGLLAKLSEEVGVSVANRSNLDMVIYTDSGVTLFEATPRPVTFSPTFAFGATTTGAAVFADGVPLTGGGATMGIKAGAIFGHARLRDETAVTYQKQIGEIARGLVDAFSEPSGPGLFAHTGLPVTDGTPIAVNPAADPALGGDLDRLRDGFNPPGYNPGGDAGFTGRLDAMLDALGAARAFDPAAGINPNTTLVGFASASVSWLEGARQRADADSAYETTLLERSSEALSNATGVNLDEELALMLELERSYGASARIITAVDTMLQSLLDAVR